MNNDNNNVDFTRLASDIKALAKSIGFQDVRIVDGNLSNHKAAYKSWISNRMHGEMSYLARNIDKRFKPPLLVADTKRIICVRYNYLPLDADIPSTLKNKSRAYISRYALGRDYHKVIRNKLQLLATLITKMIGAFGYRAFCDSAPVLERGLAQKCGIGWIGKNTMILNRQAGSWFFLGELYTTLPLPCDQPVSDHCGSCTACIDICPTQAIIAPYQLNASRCISYLTIELKGSIPEQFRSAIGNRIFGCDDCQIVCPWNKFAQFSEDDDFKPRHSLNNITLIELFNWTENEFLKKTEGSAIRRTGYNGWLRNIAVALGNAPTHPSIIHALQSKITSNEMVKEHIAWALTKLQQSNNYKHLENSSTTQY